MSEAQWEERALKAEARVALLESESDDMAFALAELRKRLPASSGGGGGLSTPEPSSSSHEQACDGYSPMVVHGDVGHQLHASCAVVVVERACASSNCLAVLARRKGSIDLAFRFETRISRSREFPVYPIWFRSKVLWKATRPRTRTRLSS